MRAIWSDIQNCSHNVSQTFKRIRLFACRISSIIGQDSSVGEMCVQANDPIEMNKIELGVLSMEP